MRVITGSLKGRRLETPSWEGLRPTSDKLRETLFNVLGPRVAGARVLDGYAGTGAVGIEAISRGAAHVAFVESDRRAQALIARNLAHCGIVGGYVLVRDTLARALRRLRPEPPEPREPPGPFEPLVPFDIVFLDPPYDEDATSVLEAVGASVGAIKSGGLVVLEHARRRRPPAQAGSLQLTRVIESGDSALAFYLCRP